MGKMNTGAVLFNLSGGAILLAVVGYAGFDLFHTEQASQCALRYPAGKQLAFDDKAGKLLTPIELQGRAGSREWGLLNNAQIVASPEVPGRASMQVDIAATGDDENAERSGAGFTWEAPDLSKATSACLSYSIMLPPKFKFGAPGHLPGLFSAANASELDSKEPADSFAARVGWSENGDLGIDLKTSAAGSSWQGMELPEPWPVGRWVPVEQEVQLNAPGAENGTLRMWVDGKLVIENRAVQFRSDAQSRLSGVVADIGYAGKTAEPAVLKVSPFVVQWQ